MRLDPLRVLGTIVAALLMFFSTVIINQSFTVFEYAPSGFEKELMPVGETIGPVVSRVLWNNRYMDLVALAILLFIAGSCCLGLLINGRDAEA